MPVTAASPCRLHCHCPTNRPSPWPPIWSAMCNSLCAPFTCRIARSTFHVPCRCILFEYEILVLANNHSNGNSIRSTNSHCNGTRVTQNRPSHEKLKYFSASLLFFLPLARDHYVHPFSVMSHIQPALFLFSFRSLRPTAFPPELITDDIQTKSFQTRSPLLTLSVLV